MSRCCLLLVACSAASVMRQFVSCSASDISNHTAREQSRNPERERLRVWTRASSERRTVGKIHIVTCFWSDLSLFLFYMGIKGPIDVFIRFIYL